MEWDAQPVLRGNLVSLRPLEARDFDALYSVASDPMIWKQHPARDRSDLPAFQRFFEESLASGGALAIVDTRTSELIGATRFHGYDVGRSEVEVGWTFLARSHWGGEYNGEVKALMFQHAFQFVDQVVLLISPTNVRSCRAAEKVGAVRSGSRLDASGRRSHVYAVSAPDTS